jgi:hypothetical protein
MCTALRNHAVHDSRGVRIRSQGKPATTVTKYTGTGGDASVIPSLTTHKRCARKHAPSGGPERVHIVKNWCMVTAPWIARRLVSARQRLSQPLHGYCSTMCRCFAPASHCDSCKSTCTVFRGTMVSGKVADVLHARTLYIWQHRFMGSGIIWSTHFRFDIIASCNTTYRRTALQMVTCLHYKAEHDTCCHLGARSERT